MKRLFVFLALTALALSVAAPAGAGGRRLSAADRKAISRSIDIFVNHAVKRQNVGASYGVVAPEFRAGMTRTQWAKGNIPAYPYPARGTTHGWSIRYVTPQEVGVDLILRPRPGVKMQGIVFNVYLRPVHGRWLIDSFMPAATINTEMLGNQARVRSIRDFMPGTGSGGGPEGKPAVSANYAFIPFALIGALLLGLAAVLVWGALRYRPRGAALPPLPRSRRS